MRGVGNKFFFFVPWIRQHTSSVFSCSTPPFFRGRPTYLLLRGLYLYAISLIISLLIFASCCFQCFNDSLILSFTLYSINTVLYGYIHYKWDLFPCNLLLFSKIAFLYFFQLLRNSPYHYKVIWIYVASSVYSNDLYLVFQFFTNHNAIYKRSSAS